MATQKQSESNGSIVEAVRRAGTEAIDTYERQAEDAILQGEGLVKDLPGMGTVAGTQARVARVVVDAQTRTARQLIGA
jgi:hypothetical protein